MAAEPSGTAAARPAPGALTARIAETSGGDWRRDAACRGEPLELFFPRLDVVPDEARRICTTCPAVTACLEYALAPHVPPIIGVWAGLSASERRRLKRQVA
jgi:WhiB family redox-sensing transcriptional regulator